MSQTCRTCRHWAEHPRPRPDEASRTGECTLAEARSPEALHWLGLRISSGGKPFIGPTDMKAVVEPGMRIHNSRLEVADATEIKACLVTHRDFGCLDWQERRTCP